jgi:glycosyltransferase involved in cell wall biosynthesis
VRRYYVQASPHHLTRPDKVRAKLRAEGARFICLVHDLIPIEYPEYARPNGADLHRRRVRTMAELADGLIANSEATARSMARFIGETGRLPPIRVAHLGSDPLPDVEVAPPALSDPYFVVLSTIEPRKNHLLLLNIWRRMIETLGPERTPHLAIVGRRGWENENVIDMLERCTAIQDHVHEYAGLSDARLSALLRRARALLCPSFAEGFGMPVTEALLSGTPVICSDLPALREAGGDVPDFIDPLDGPEWIRAIMDYSGSQPGMREAQLERLRDWAAPGWDDHIRVLLGLIRAIDAAEEER